jgi:hypothetical protein
MGEVIQVAVANWGTALGDDEVDRGIDALQTQLDRDFAPEWGVRAKLTPLRPVVRQPGVWGLLLRRGKSADAQFHCEASTAGLPVAEVFVGDLADGQQWTHAASRALLEMLVDPVASRGAYGPFRGNGEQPASWLWAHEITAPCSRYERGYEIRGWRVSDFVRPAWFGVGQPARGFDHCARIHTAFGVLDGERVFAYDLSSGAWLEVGSNSVREVAQPPGPRLARLVAALTAARTRVGTHGRQEGGIWGGP